MKKLFFLLMAVICTVGILTACGGEEDKITSLSIVDGTIETVVTEGEELDTSALEVTVTYKSGKTATVGRDKLTVDNVDTSTVGTKKLKVTYKGFSAEFDITVESGAPTLTEISVVSDSLPDKVMLGATVDTSEIKVTATYSDGTTKVITAEELEIGTPDTSEAGNATFTVSYGGKSVDATVTVIGVKEMQISGVAGIKLEVGDAPSYTGIGAVVTYTDDTNATLSSAELAISNIDTATPGEKTLSVTYLGTTVSTTVYVDCVMKVTLQHLPAKVDVGATISTDGVDALVEWHSGDKTLVSLKDLTISIPLTDTKGDKIVSATYKGVSGTATVKVVGVESIVLTDVLPTEIKLGERFNPPPADAFVASANMTDGTQRKLKYSDLTKSGSIDTESLGNKTLALGYLDGTVNYTVKIYGVREIAVDATSVDTTVTQGLKPDISGLKIYVVYDNAGATRELVTAGFTTNFDKLNFDDAEDDVLTVTYDMGAFGVQSCTVTFSTTPPVVTSISATVASGKDRIFKGDAFDKSSVSVVASYNNKTTSPVTGFTVGDVDSTTVGAKSVTVTYGSFEASVTVTVVEVVSVAVSGDTLINLGTEYNYEGLVVSATISDGTNTSTVFVPAGEYTVNGAIDKNTMGDQSITVTYRGIESEELGVHVKGVSEIALLDAPTGIRIGGALNKDLIKLVVTYSDGSRVTIPLSAAGVEITSDVNTTAAGETSFTVSYQGKTVTSESITVGGTVVMITILSTSVKNEVLVGEKYDYSGIKIIIVYEDGDGNPLTADTETIDVNAEGLKVTPPVTSTTGDKALMVEYNDIVKTIGVHVKGVSKLTPVADSYASSIKLGATPNFSDIKFIVDFTNGTQSVIGIESLDSSINVEEITSATEGGVKKAYATYKGVAAEIEITVVKVVEGAGDGEIIVGVALSDEILSHKGYSNNFKVTDEPYYVGSYNPWKFYLELVVLDSDRKIVVRDGKNFRFVYEIKEVIDGVPTDIEDPSTVVSVVGNSYQFTKAAEGRVFEITLTPDADDAYNIIGAPEDLSASHTVKVVDAYNIYEAWELNFLSNSPIGQFDLNGTAPGTVDQRTAVNRYLTEVKGIEDPDAIIETINGIVIHGNISITVDDIPEEYICKYSESGRPLSETVLYDSIGVYDHMIKGNSGRFDFYGNYFTIYSYDLPCVVKTGDHVTNSDDVSNAGLFRFRTRTAYDVKNFDHKNYVVNLHNIAFRDNDPNSNVQADSERHMRGLTCIKPMFVYMNVYNTNVDAFYVSLCAEDDDLTVNIDKSKFYNAWQGHIFIWNNNYHHIIHYGEDSKDAETRSTYQNIKINITDSMLAKCGGPVILSQQDDKNKLYNANSGADVVATDSVLYSYVTGQEAWFVAVGQTTMAGQILAMDGLVSGTSRGTASYLANSKINGVETMNMIMVNMGSGLGFEDLGYEGTFTKVTTDGNGNEISRVTGLNMHNPEPAANPFASNNPMLYIYKGAMSSAPIFQSSAGGTAFGVPIVGQELPVGLYSIDLTTQAPGALETAVFDGEYMTMYYMGLGIMLESYNASNPASTPVVTPADWLAN